MTRYTRWALFGLVVVASIWTARPARAQDTAKPKAPAKVEVTINGVTDSVTVAEVQKAAEQLAIAVQEAVRKATEDPAVKVAALKVAKSAVTAAQVAITQQADALQTMLDTLAREISMATEKQQSKAKNH